MAAKIAFVLCVAFVVGSVSSETEGLDTPSGRPLVIDPDVVEELQKQHNLEKQEEEPTPDESNDTKPKTEVLYVPKGCKRKSSRNDLMVVQYTGWLAKSGRKFDTTIDYRRRYAPFEFVLGTGYVIKGWEVGLMDMCPGEKRKLVVPPALAYGKKGLRGIIPPNSTLIFIIDLLDLRRATPNYSPIDLFTSLDKDGDKTLSRDEISEYVKYQSKMYSKKDAPKPSPQEHEKMVDEIMEKEDQNGDGVIQHAEFSGPKMPHGGEL